MSDSNDIWSIFIDHGPGTILHAVQMARLFPDSKTFVDMKLKKSKSEILQHFQLLLEAQNTSQEIPKEEIRAFVEENFENDIELVSCVPTDWVEKPDIVNKISDSNYSHFALALNERWKQLCRKISNEVKQNPEKYSILYLPNPVVVPGGRFREIYYWDSYWIIIGLLHCQMFDTVKGMLLNFVHLIKNYGLIPNGGRCYYICRSQPPLFIQMVQKYVEATNDMEFIRDNLGYMEAEFDYWLANHMLTFKYNGETLSMAHYNCKANGPRPESYFEDYQLVNECNGSQELYHELKSAAESGWDFSSRWFVPPEGDCAGQLKDTRTSFIIPVDLNSILEKNSRILSEYFSDDPEKSEKFRSISNDLRNGIETVLWNDELGVWLDFDYVNKKERKAFSISNIFPMWTRSCVDDSKIPRVVDYIKTEGLEDFIGGVPSTKDNTGQQWDFPNCWPPLEHILVVGLEQSGHEEAKQLALRFADNRVRGSYLNFKSSGHMFEKYDATDQLRVGSGGEYGVQLGFGWTNGAVLDFLFTYGDKLVAPDN